MAWSRSLTSLRWKRTVQGALAMGMGERWVYAQTYNSAVMMRNPSRADGRRHDLAEIVMPLNADLQV
jgi:hypothetical protein